ncbi:MAG: histidine kinase [Actinomycetia bacterium]|nr:histidine kinase [Actinomycetes bacterium]
MTLMASALATLANVCVCALVIVTWSGREEDFARERIADASRRVVSLIEQGRLPSVLPRDEATDIQVLDPRGRVVAATSRLVGKPPIASFRPAGNAVRADRTLCPPNGLTGCMIVVSVEVFRPDGTWVVYTAGRTVPWYGGSELLTFLVAQSLLLILLTAIVTFRAVARTLAPVGAMQVELAEMTATDLSHRVPIPKSQDEIRLLADTVNATLDRLEAAYEQQRRFTSDASHDLRSPITAMRTQLEEALLYPQDTDWPRMAKAVFASVERLQALVADLLDAAMLDAHVPLAAELSDLAELVDSELNRRPRKVEVIRDLQKGVFAVCDQLRLTRLLTNLLDNAERHANSQIRVVVRAEGYMAVMEVLDDGAGIAYDQREVVFQRFTRLDASRNRDAGGTGLGLPIARQIAEAHHGTLTIEDSPRGARFVLRLARADPPPPS